MAANRRGRLIYLDGPGTYIGLLEADVNITLSYVRIRTDGKHDVTLSIYAGQSITDPVALLADYKVAGEDHLYQEGFGHSEETTPDSLNGISVVLEGEGARAYIYKA